VDLVIVLANPTNYQEIVPFMGSGKASQITNTILQMLILLITGFLSSVGSTDS